MVGLTPTDPALIIPSLRHVIIAMQLFILYASVYIAKKGLVTVHQNEAVSNQLQYYTNRMYQSD